MQYSLNEVCLLPSSKPTDIISRSQIDPFINGKLPIFVAPMTSVINYDNFSEFQKNKVIPIIPRNCTEHRQDYLDLWHSYSLQEFESIVNSSNDYSGYHILIDIANGHIGKIYDLVKQAKSKWPSIIIMIGNIAHPDMYIECCKAGVDYVRVGIGSGSVCSTSVQCGVHASHQWMIEGIKKLKNCILGVNDDGTYYYNNHGVVANLRYITKTIADGGINTLDKAIKCLAIGYDYIMMGKCFAQCEEACGEIKNEFRVLPHSLYDSNIHTIPIKRRKYYGMASEQGQIDISGGCNKNPEGIETWVEVNNTLEQFSKKFEAALRSTMSYVGAHNLEELKNNTQYDIMSIEEFKSYYK